MKFHSIYLIATASFGISSARTCLNQSVAVTIESRNAVFGNQQIPRTQIDVTAFAQNMTRQGSNYTAQVLTGYNTIYGTYNISTQFCYNQNATRSSAVQILTHGIGFDKTYWDLPFNGYNYSYVNSALDTGFSTLSYDRLGIGNSSHGEPLDEIQINLEIASLRALTAMIREGRFPGVNKTFDDIIHVGHSFGSAQTFIFSNMYPNETSGIVLTGFSLNTSFVGYFGAGANFQSASQNAPLRFGNVNGDAIQNLLAMTPLWNYIQPFDFGQLPAGQNLPDGYLISRDAGADQYLFFLPGYFDPQLLTLSEKTKQPVTIGELLTLAGGPNTSQFSGPVLIFTGSADLPYCGGDCLNTGGAAASIPAMAQMGFPSVPQENFTAYIQPNTGHALTAHYNASEGYRVINNFLMSKGF